MSVFHLFVDFQGLSTAEGMEQADVARAMARGEGSVTKTLRPIALAKLQERTGVEEIPLKLPATSHGPLNPLVNAGLLKISGTEYPVDFKYRIYFPDRVIAGGSMFCFFGALGLTFLLVSRLFDGVLAGFTVVAMLVCEMMWRFTQTGLPQMLGLLVFMAGLVFLESSLRRWRLGGIPLLGLIGAGFSFGLLVLTTPIGLGVAVAAAFFVLLIFKKRMLLPLSFLFVMTLTIAPWIVGNLQATGSLLGVSTVEVQDSWGESAGSPIMRSFEPGAESAHPRLFLAKKMGRVLTQHFENFWLLVGGSVGAGLFWLSMLHPFRNPDAVHLRNGIALMWGGSLVGMMLFGTPDLVFDANQVHVWFIPIATAFGLAILSVFWMRLPIAQNHWSLWQRAHLIAAVILTALPMMINLPGRATLGLFMSNRVVHWPPYDPAAIAFLGDWTDDRQVIFSDVPWAVAWYADRPSVWLPMEPAQFQEIAKQIEDRDPNSVAGIFLTPQTLDQPLASGVMSGDYEPWNRVLLNGPLKSVNVTVFEQAPSGLRYTQRLSASNDQESWFFSSRPIWRETRNLAGQIEK
ncbi:MAG: hypothetical protein HKN23_06100 [Verrucomicrobiales bacterium]|nr:hypothetical protein [Verrucomicrobiales bacterium]